MFLKKKSHNLFKKSINLALKSVKTSVVLKKQYKNQVDEETDSIKNDNNVISEDINKPKRTYKPKKNGDEQVFEGE